MPRLLVIGDVMLDRFVRGRVERISPEAPVPVLTDADETATQLGGAANVAAMVVALGGDATLLGVVGDDPAGRELRQHVRDARIDAQLVAELGRPTTTKTRFLCGQHPLLRVDQEERSPIATSTHDVLLSRWEALRDDLSGAAVLIADYSKGVLTERLLSRVILDCRQRRIPVLVDPGPRANWWHYHGATAIKPNRLEAGRELNRSIDTLDAAIAAAADLRKRNSWEHVFLTLDRDGIVWSGQPAYTAPLETQHVRTPDLGRSLDVTGCGDQVLAVLGYGFALGLPTCVVTRMAERAGRLQVQRSGCVPVSMDELQEIKPREGSAKIALCPRQLVRAVTARKERGERIVFTNGCFDLLHAGHVSFLEEARQEGDCLVVALNADETVKRLKGPTRPLVPAAQRAAMLAALECVDHVIVFHEETPEQLLRLLRPDVLAKGGTTPEVVGRAIVEEQGGRVVTLSAMPDVSTTLLEQRLKAA